jgi:HAE1 family hydrophobic/amphiphilic exporter-1/multidrug efflux pump
MIGGLMVFLFARTPSGFLPEEDQGVLFTIVQGPTGSTSEATDRVLAQVTDHYLNNESDLVKGIFTVSGFSFAGQGQNMGFAFVGLNDWSERTKPDQSVSAIAGRAFGAFSQIQEALVFPIVPPAVIELGNVSGFDFYLQARNGQSHEQLIEARNQLMGMAAQSDKIASVRPNGLEDATQFKLDIDWRAAGAMGLSPNEIGNMLSVAWAGRYVNDFLDGGRIKRVYVQGDAPYRMVPEDIERWRVRNSTGGLVPFSTFSTASWEYGAQGLYRYNGVPSVQLQGSPAAGVTTGEGMAEMEALAANLPPGFEIAWTGLSLEEIESGDQAGLLYALSLAAVFLCLAALYESWSIPCAVMLAMPIGITGALIGAWLGGFENGVYFQVALLTVIGLTGKNAILIVEFAREQVQAGVPLYEGVAEAAKQRFRPILMTSMAFSLGVLPLVTASGAGSGGRTAIGTGVFSGTISATLLGVLFVPVFFVVIQKLIQKR